MIYTYPEDNYRVHTPIPRGSRLWKKIYKKRVVSEHAISRLKVPLNMGRLNVRDYHSVFAELALAAIAQNVVALVLVGLGLMTKFVLLAGLLLSLLFINPILRGDDL